MTKFYPIIQILGDEVCAQYFFVLKTIQFEYVFNFKHVSILNMLQRLCIIGHKLYPILSN